MICNILYDAINLQQSLNGYNNPIDSYKNLLADQFNLQ